MKSTGIKKIAVFSLVCLLFLVTSCSSNTQPGESDLKITDLSSIPEEFQGYDWIEKISTAEAAWQSANISDYEIAGRVTWGGHIHSFQVTLLNKKIRDSKCELEYDGPLGEGWCDTEFDATQYSVPALFEEARQLLKRHYELCPQEHGFFAHFDYDTGVPKEIRFNCSDARDEEVSWTILFFPDAP